MRSRDFLVLSLLLFFAPFPSHFSRIDLIARTEPSVMADKKSLSTQQVAGHNTPNDCWIVVENHVWDVTDFLEEHPGGSASEHLIWKKSE